MDELWPDVPMALVLAIFTVLLGGCIAVLIAGWRLTAWMRPDPADPLPSLATVRDVEPFTPAGVAERARQLRPTLARIAVSDLAPDETGVTLGRLCPRGPLLRSSWEDAAVAVMAPRSYKTTALGVPTVIAAPGPVVVTSNKADLWAGTASLRAAGGRAVWTFDPQSIAFAPQDWWWNPLAAVTTVEEAERLAGHFVLTIDDQVKRDFWGAGATELLSALLLAAAMSGGSLLDVYAWLTDDGNADPLNVLEQRPEFTAQAHGLRGIQNTAIETRAGIYQTARTAARCLRDPQITAWVTPPASGTLATFDPYAFTATRDTLYLLSKDGGGSAAPLVAALADRVMRDGIRRAESRGGRLDPPLVVVLDEAANICRIADLPTLYSHLGSRGIVPLTVLQSWSQGETVWGQAGMQALWGAATVKVVGPGMDDERFAESLSRLLGEHDVPVASYSRGGRDRTLTESVSLRRQRILPPDKIRALRKGTALLLATGCPGAVIELQPWFTGPRARDIAAAEAAATKLLTTRASTTAW
jgi:type IV secretory pathway TraG/TraD family ATPase VirD4